jgi:hypothetical protein
MFANRIGFIFEITFLSGFQFLGCWLYLSFSKKITVPMDSKSNIAIGIAWILMVAFVDLVGLLGIWSVDFFEMPMHRANGKTCTINQICGLN